MSAISSSSWQKWILLIVIIGITVLWISPVSASAATDWYDKGISFYNTGRYDEALTAYNQAIELNPNNVGAWNNKGNALQSLGRYDEALVAFNKAIELDPNYDQAITNKINVLSKLSQGTTTFVTTSTTQASNPIITTSSPNQTPTSFNPMIIVGIIFLLCIGGGGYYDLQSRKTPKGSDPTPPKVICEYQWEELVSTRRKGQQLTLFAKPIEQHATMRTNSIFRATELKHNGCARKRSGRSTGLKPVKKKFSGGKRQVMKRPHLKV